MKKQLDNILNTTSKVKIIRLFISRREDFMASGREVARLIGLTPPAAHTAMKELYNYDVLKREIIGKQHIYRLNVQNRTVKNILLPAFKEERSIKEDVLDFLKKQVEEKKLKTRIVSIFLYGSLEKDETDEKSDVDIVIITRDKKDKVRLEKIFIENIANRFFDYFGLHLDIYIKTKDEFINRLKKNLPPASTLRKSYSVIYGKDIVD